MKAGVSLARALLCATMLAGVVVSAPVRASATLGGDATSVQRDRAKFNATLRVTTTERYAVHEMQAASGVKVREYLSADGKVFAVTWQGAFQPDYRQLLGDYFPRLSQAAPSGRARRAPAVIETQDFVFQLAGHMRAYSGRAYLPQALPSGVTVEEIR